MTMVTRSLSGQEYSKKVESPFIKSSVSPHVTQSVVLFDFDVDLSFLFGNCLPKVVRSKSLLCYVSMGYPFSSLHELFIEH